MSSMATGKATVSKNKWLAPAPKSGEATAEAGAGDRGLPEADPAAGVLVVGTGNKPKLCRNQSHAAKRATPAGSKAA